jgi:hypothetical protein
MTIRHILAAGALAAVVGSTPEIIQINPAAPGASSQPQAIAISGKDFLPGLSLEIQTPDSRTLRVNGGSITIAGPEAMTASMVLDVPGAYLMKVNNTDGGISRPFSFQVRGTPAAAAKAAPAGIVIDRVVPDSPAKSDQPQTIHLEGRNLDSGIGVSVTDPAGSDVPDVTVSKATSTGVDIILLLNQRGEYVLQANNRAGATSNRVTIKVQ